MAIELLPPEWVRGGIRQIPRSLSLDFKYFESSRLCFYDPHKQYNEDVVVDRQALWRLLVISACALSLISCHTSRNADLPRVVIANCYDGDTCTTVNGEKVRLACIDTPELRGKKADPIPAKAARDFLRSMIEGKEVNLKRLTVDRYGRSVAEVFLDGANINQVLVRQGYASIYAKYAYQCMWTKLT